MEFCSAETCFIIWLDLYAIVSYPSARMCFVAFWRNMHNIVAAADGYGLCWESSASSESYHYFLKKHTYLCFEVNTLANLGGHFDNMWFLPRMWYLKNSLHCFLPQWSRYRTEGLTIPVYAATFNIYNFAINLPIGRSTYLWVDAIANIPSVSKGGLKVGAFRKHMAWSCAIRNRKEISKERKTKQNNSVSR